MAEPCNILQYVFASLLNLWLFVIVGIISWNVGHEEEVILLFLKIK